MKPKLIIIRGNSGSGKTTIATLLQHELGYGTMLVSQDVIRRKILRVPDGIGNPSIELIKQTAAFGKSIGYTVILEGILGLNKYGDMLHDLISLFEDNCHVYYFDIPFEETLRRHMLKPESDEFGEQQLREFWREQDWLGVDREKIITPEMSEETIVALMRDDIENK